jgi:hypothetical protein
VPIHASKSATDYRLVDRLAKLCRFLRRAELTHKCGVTANSSVSLIAMSITSQAEA